MSNTNTKQTETLETVINRAITNGNRIQENGIGTIFATDKQLLKMDAFADKQEKARRALGAKDLGHLDKRNEGGEVHYNDDRTMKPLRPCPFCRHSDRLEIRWRVKGGHFVECLHCLASGPRVGNESECVNDWNSAIRKFDLEIDT